VSDGIRIYPITPSPYVRQTRADKWKKRPSVLKYRAFRDEVALHIKELPADFFHVVFLIPVPMSWSEKKKAKMIGRPHLGTPDKDNLEKGLFDAVYRFGDDGHIWNSSSTKLWAGIGAIIIADDYLPFFEIPVDLAELVRGSWEVYDRVIV
jgi:Holliday junction resolvase RusA-like endonuclease